MLPYSDSMSIHGKPSSYIPPVPGLVVRMLHGPHHLFQWMVRNGPCSISDDKDKKNVINLLWYQQLKVLKIRVMQGLLWLPKSRSQKNHQVPFSGASFESQEPIFSNRNSGWLDVPLPVSCSVSCINGPDLFV